MYRYLNLPFPKTPDLSFASKYKNKDTLLVNPKTNFKIIFADKDVNSYKNIPYDNEIEIDKDIRFDFQNDLVRSYLLPYQQEMNRHHFSYKLNLYSLSLFLFSLN